MGHSEACGPGSQDERRPQELGSTRGGRLGSPYPGSWPLLPGTPFYGPWVPIT